MSAANDLIERMERETGQRIDEPGSLAFAGLMGALARGLGVSNHEEMDDVSTGLLLKHQSSHEYKAEKRGKELSALLFMAGLGIEP